MGRVRPDKPAVRPKKEGKVAKEGWMRVKKVLRAGTGTGVTNDGFKALGEESWGR